MADSSKEQIGFLKIIEIGEDRDFRGALLVTDGESFPIELIYSEAISPTIIEKIAFGVTLNYGINIKRIAIPLIQKLQNKPNFILVDDSGLLKVQKETKTIICYPIDGGLIDKDSFFKESETYLKKVNEILEKYPDLDLSEPFSRLIEAIQYVHFEQEETKEGMSRTF